MKITRSSDTVKLSSSNRTIANKGCEKCPECGHVSKFGGGVCKSWAEGIFKTRYYRVDCYSCNECGCQWESEKYEHY